MKKLIALCFIAIINFKATAQDAEAYQKYMQESIALYDSVKTLADYQEIANRFDRISATASSEWLPLYYAGLTHIYMSFVKGLEDDTRDEHIDKALDYIDRAEEIAGENSETVILRGYAYMAKVSVSPALRGMTLSAKVTGLFEKGLVMEPENPRANLMLGRWKYGSAQFFGRSTDDACAYMQKALAIYKNQEKGNGLEPAWGENQAQSMSKRCQGKS
ncbi:tetratricopeptide repeat protein [Croceimicrobium hydrocarbonivorans]|uniref:Tetratricopeptide repeat protein n=1 Tax=Croceimicrobium hydrocarbonivorans TaxID=2761580 RepID=A0A7H0VBK9_9FLAO|nr:hypothetical protein [Croceimicrobium hydrocarbonivorans]QNR23107.1 hypothetical protein H4K34_12055 [Croceimicrobium hydrocarbonivorans]